MLGIGAQKCASSWLHAVAGTHPQIYCSSPKEIDFFSYYFDRGYAWYERYFASAIPQQLRMEISPSYFHDPRAAARAKNFDPAIRVIALLRDPVKRAFSNHLHEIIKGHIPPCPFEEGLVNNPAYLEQGNYGTHLAKWFEHFSDDRILVLFAENVSADPAREARRLFEFLGVSPDFNSAILRERRNESDRARLPILRTGLRAGGDWMRRQGMEDVLARIKATGPIAATLRANSVSVADEIPPMRPETCNWLREYFASEDERLKRLLGRDELPWSANQAVVAREEAAREEALAAKERSA